MFVELQVRVEDWPRVIEVGLAEIFAVGAGATIHIPPLKMLPEPQAAAIAED